MSRPILVLLPTLGRSASLMEFLGTFFRTSSGLADVLVVASDKDDTRLDIQGDQVHTLTGPYYSFAQGLNAAPMDLLARYKIVGWMADDIRCQTLNWDVRVAEVLENDIGMVYTRDELLNEKLATHPFWSTQVSLALGFIAPSVLKHFCLDHYIHALFRQLGRAHYLDDLVFEHRHFSRARSSFDPVYQRSQAWVAQDGAAWRNYREQQLQLDIEKLKTALSL